MALTSGTRLGPYEIQSLLGAGGMGEVYCAHDSRLDRTVAIKVLPASFSADRERLQRFAQEARAAAALNHPNILSVFDIGEEQGAPFVVSELLEGETLRERLRTAIGVWEAGNEVPRGIVPELNRLMSEHPMRTRLIATAHGLERQGWFETQRPEDLFAPLAEGAAALFTEVSRDRVRKCAECVLHFQDTSKKGTRRWCSMRLCGNRLKVAAYAARRRGA
jgi:predicted RNA-binding Zn ribbon-like protein